MTTPEAAALTRRPSPRPRVAHKSPAGVVLRSGAAAPVGASPDTAATHPVAAAIVSALPRTVLGAGVGLLLDAATVAILHYTGHATPNTDLGCWFVAVPFLVTAFCSVLVLALPPRETR